MPSTFENRLDAGLYAHLDAEFGVSASTYTPPGGGAAIPGLTVQLDTESAGVTDFDGGGTELETFDALLTLAESALASVLPGGRFSVDSVDWTVLRDPPPFVEFGRWNVAVKRSGTTRVPLERMT